MTLARPLSEGAASPPLPAGQLPPLDSEACLGAHCSGSPLLLSSLTNLPMIPLRLPSLRRGNRGSERCHHSAPMLAQCGSGGREPRGLAPLSRDCWTGHWSNARKGWRWSSEQLELLTPLPCLHPPFLSTTSPLPFLPSVCPLLASSS